MITNLTPETIRQPTLWGELDREKRNGPGRRWTSSTHPLGRDTVRILGAGGPKNAAWKFRAEHRSPRWTTRWDELPQVRFKTVGTNVDVP